MGMDQGMGIESVFFLNARTVSLKNLHAVNKAKTKETTPTNQILLNNVKKIQQCMKIDKQLNNFLSKRGLNYEWRKTEHFGCWDRGCSHLENELNIWHGNERKFSWSFEENCTSKMIIETLEDRLEEPWVKEIIATPNP